MRKLILHSILLLSVFSISSCNYLDVDKWFDDTMKYDSIFSRKEYLERYMWNVASMFPDEGDFLNSPATAGPLATDEAFETFNAEKMCIRDRAPCLPKWLIYNGTISLVERWNDSS